MGFQPGSGRKPDPPHLRVLKNDKAHAHRYKDRNEPEPSDTRASAPASLSPDAKVFFDEMVERIEEMYPCSATDSWALVLYANNHEQLLYLENYLRVKGLTYESDTQWGTTIKKRPEVEIHKQCKDFELRILTEFGLTPSSRARVNIPKKPEPKKNPFADLDAVNK